jgi:ArsR family transcriptional regulator, arsenate/arsenite/antimonite-responsive transcriptional repressor
MFAHMNETTTSPACCSALDGRLDPEVFRALGDAVRVALVTRLAGVMGSLTVTEISSCCGVHLSGVSRHLKVLRDAGVVAAKREGREVRYTLDCGALAQHLRAIAAALDECKAACAAD